MLTNVFTVTGDVVPPSAPGEEASFLATADYNNHLQTAAVDWTNNEAMCKIVSFPTTPGAKFTMEARGGHGRLEVLNKSDGTRRANYYIGTTSQVASADIDFMLTPFYIAGYTATEMYFKKSADGITWTEVARAAYTPPTSATCRFHAYNGTATTDRVVARYLNTAVPSNTKPVVSAGADQALSTGSTVALLASATDTEGGTLTYDWSFVTIPAGSTATMPTGTTPDRSFVADVPGSYTARVTATDPEGLVSDPDDVVILVENKDSVISWTAALGGEAAISKYEIGLVGSEGTTEVIGETVNLTYTDLAAPSGNVYLVRAVDVNLVAGPWSDPTSASGVGTDVEIQNTDIGTTELTVEYILGFTNFSEMEHYSGTTGHKFRLRYNGTRIVVHGARDLHHGIASVSRNGIAAANVDCYAASRIVDDVLYDSGTHADGAHYVDIEVTGTKNASSSGTVVAFNRAIATSTGALAPPATADPTVGWALLANISDEFDGDMVDYLSTSRQDELGHQWYTEPYKTYDVTCDKINGDLVKTNTIDYWRSWSKAKFGAVRKSIRIDSTLKATSIVDNTGSTPGVKFGMKYPNPDNPYYPDDPRGVRGTHSDTYPSPGSFQFFSPCTLDGELQWSINAFGPSSDNPYRFAGTKRIGYTVGDEKRVVWQIDWEEYPYFRARCWVDKDPDTTTPDVNWRWGTTDAPYDFWNQPGAFLWLRVDGTAFKMKHVRVSEYTP